MRVMVIGNGAREHALVWKISQSPKVDKIFTAPGNAGTAQISENLTISPTDLEGLAKAAKTNRINLVIVGPEVPLSLGIADYFKRLGIPIFGPSKRAAQLETSKTFAKELMEKYKLPCAKGRTFSSYPEARKYVQSQQFPIVIKADGLAGGKGSIMAESWQEATRALSDIMEAKIFGSAGDSVIIEEYLKGLEVSLIAFTDGKTIVPMMPSCDYKRARDKDTGPNTGGMGGYSPPSFFPSQLVEKSVSTILMPTIKALSNQGITYKGILYAGLIIANGKPKILEFNARFGDPETQITLPLLRTDLIDILLAIIQDDLDHIDVEWYNSASVGVVMTSGGYPQKYKSGLPIEGLDKVDKDILVFHAGTKSGNSGKTYTNGGRVLTVAGTGDNLTEARAKVYRNISRISFQDHHYRRDIALREIK